LLHQQTDRSEKVWQPARGIVLAGAVIAARGEGRNDEHDEHDEGSDG
jgi:hypothetical protein